MHTECVEFKSTKLLPAGNNWHFMMPARHTKWFSYYYFSYFRHVAMLQKFANPIVGAPFCGGPCLAEHA